MHVLTVQGIGRGAHPPEQTPPAQPLPGGPGVGSAASGSSGESGSTLCNRFQRHPTHPAITDTYLEGKLWQPSGLEQVLTNFFF